MGVVRAAGGPGHGRVADQRVGEPAVLGLELIQGNITAVMGVHIEDNEAIARTGRNGNIGVRMVGPPSVDVLGTNMAKASFTSVGSEADSPEPLLRPSPATDHDAEKLDVYDPDLGYDAENFPISSPKGV